MQPAACLPHPPAERARGSHPCPKAGATLIPLSAHPARCAQPSTAQPACWLASQCAACASACCPARRRGGQCGCPLSAIASSSCLPGRRRTGTPACASLLRLVCIGLAACLHRAAAAAAAPGAAAAAAAAAQQSTACWGIPPALRRELQRMLLAHPPPNPPSVHVELPAGSLPAAGQQQQPAGKLSGGGSQGGSDGGSEAMRGAVSGASAASLAGAPTDSQPAGTGADAAAAQLSGALQVRGWAPACKWVRRLLWHDAWCIWACCQAG